MEQEIWLPIKYGNGKKEISNCGNIRNAVTKRVLKSYISKKGGYRCISFWVDGRSMTFKIHRLVAEHFIPNPNNKITVNHKDLDKLNNNVSNLEWHTISENIDHYYKNGFNGMIGDDDVLFIRENIEALGCNKIAEKLGVSWNYVLAIANGTYKADVHKELIRVKRPSLPRKVEKYDKDDNFIEAYNSIGEAAKMNNAKLSYIQRVLTGEHKTYRGFKYKCEGYRQVKRKKSNIEHLLEWKRKKAALG